MEFIVLDHGVTDKGSSVTDIIAAHSTRAMILRIPRRDRESHGASLNVGASRASYPYLLFLDSATLFMHDILPTASAMLEHGVIGVVGCGIDDVAGDDVDKTATRSFRRTGIDMEWDEKNQRYRSVVMRQYISDSGISVRNNLCHAVSGEFLLCRKEDFQAIGGFSEAYDNGHEAIDFCLRMARELKKACYSINEVGLQCVKKGDQKISLPPYLTPQPPLHEWRGGDMLRDGRDIAVENDVSCSFPNYDIPIVVIAYNRVEPLTRLLKSLDAVKYQNRVDLVISIDGGSDNEKVIGVANHFYWRHGTKSIEVQKKNLGLKSHVLQCSDIALQHDGVIILEDDLFVSPFFYHYAQHAFDFYRNDDKIAGISLYSPRYNETALMPFSPYEDGSDTYFMQVPSSWGQLWSKKQWQSFKSWLTNSDRADAQATQPLPGNVQNWPDTSWKKEVFKFIIEKETFFVYPRVSLTTNFGDDGVHMKKNKVFHVPLICTKKRYRFFHFNDSAAHYDAFCEMQPHALSKLYPKLSLFEYVVDLYGMKTDHVLDKEYILTSKPVKKYVLEFGQEMIPLEANILHEVRGTAIKLARKSFCNDTADYYGCLGRQLSLDNFLYHYSVFEEVLCDIGKKAFHDN